MRQVGENHNSIVRGVMMQARDGALYYWCEEPPAPSDIATVWVKQDESSHWRTCVAGGVNGIPVEVMARLAPFTVVGVPHSDSVEDLEACEAEISPALRRPRAPAT